jgi:hypothetical protein
MTWTILVLAILAVVLWSFYISWRASRLDRLHNRVEAARTALDLALVRRASAASDLASSGLLDPATSLLLADAVRRARLASRAERRDLAESDLTRALRVTLGEPGIRGGLEDDASPDARDRVPGGRDGTAAPAAQEDPAEEEGAEELFEEVEKAARQVFIARKFYNDVAGRTIDARRRPLARVLRLSGSAKQPEFFDMDDELTVGDG